MLSSALIRRLSPKAIHERTKEDQFPGLVAIEYEKEGAVNEDMRMEIEYAPKLA
jgi:hypothetical protein